MKDYRDMLSSLKDKVVDVAGKATVAVTDVAGKAVSDEMRDKVALSLIHIDAADE